jgi:hypothetical protein
VYDRHVRLVCVLLVLTGCRQLLGFEPATSPSDAATCVEATDCGEQICKLPEGICVDCTMAQDCGGDQPVCADDQCRACANHTECSSELCLPSGACADPSEISYVQANGTGSQCTQSAPCAELNDARPLNRRFIKIQGVEAIASGSIQRLDFDVSVFGDPGSKISRTSGGDVLEVRLSSTVVAIHDVEITGGSGTASAGVVVADGELTLENVVISNHAGRGVSLQNGDASLVMRRCVVAYNATGGANLQNGSIDITNTIFARNGAPGTNSGGVVLDVSVGSVFAFNTIADNVSLTDTNAGVNCINPIVASNNLVAGNQSSAACTFTFSMFDNSMQAPPPGTGNLSGASNFRSTDSLATSAGFYRINGGSGAIDKADPASTLATDIDGQARPDGSARDIGADEHVP